MKIRIRALTRAAIRPYGFLIDSACVRDDGRKNCYGILLKERSGGWRVGYLVVRERTIRRLERHSDSFETFEPVRGTCAIAFARPGEFRRPRIFLLDAPVVVKKGIWHEVAAVSKCAEIKIVENREVKTERRSLYCPIQITKDGIATASVGDG